MSGCISEQEFVFGAQKTHSCDLDETVERVHYTSAIEAGVRTSLILESPSAISLVLDSLSALAGAVSQPAVHLELHMPSGAFAGLSIFRISTCRYYRVHL